MFRKHAVAVVHYFIKLSFYRKSDYVYFRPHRPCQRPTFPERPEEHVGKEMALTCASPITADLQQDGAAPQPRSAGPSHGMHDVVTTQDEGRRGLRPRSVHWAGVRHTCPFQNSSSVGLTLGPSHPAWSETRPAVNSLGTETPPLRV